MTRLCAFIFFILALVSSSDARLLRGPSGPAYEGLVAARPRLLTNLDTTNKYIAGRYGLISSQALTSVRLIVGNYNLSTNAGTGASMTCTASVEYPAGTYKQETWSASASTTMADGAISKGDYITISGGIPANTAFWFWGFCNSAGGVLYFNGQNSFFSEATQASTTSFSDPTLTGTITNNQPTWGLPPIAVLGMTTSASVIVVGDSIGYGVNDIEDGSTSISGYNGKKGIVTRSLGSVPFLNLSNSSEVAQNWTTTYPTKAALIQYGSAVINELGINDLNVNNRTPTQVIADLQTINSFNRAGQKSYKTTITPESNGPWTLTGTQTPLKQAEHTSLNNSIRLTLSGWTGYYDLASVWEPTQNSDIWIPATSCGGVDCTADGVHGVVASYALVPPSAPGISMGAQTWP